MLVPNRVFRNAGGARFEEVTTAGGFGHIQKGHGVSFGDIDHDGDQDVFMVLGGAFEGDLAQNVLLLNPGRDHAWITLRLRGTASNRLGIGARIAVAVETPDGDRVIHATAGSGGSFGASTAAAGDRLGAATRIRALTVVWPGSGRRDTHRDVPLNRVVLVREGETAVETVPVSPWTSTRSLPCGTARTPGGLGWAGSLGRRTAWTPEGLGWAPSGAQATNGGPGVCAAERAMESSCARELQRARPLQRTVSGSVRG